MRVMLDEAVCDIDATSVGEAVSAAARIAEDAGRMIVDVFVDGDRLAESDLARDEATSASADEVRLISATPDALAMQLLCDMDEALDSVGQLHGLAAEHLQTDDRAQAFERLGQAITIWVNIQRGIELGSRIFEVHDDEMLRASLSGLNDRLTSLKQALEVQDTISIADILLYEMPDVVTQWKMQIAELRLQLDQRNGD